MKSKRILLVTPIIFSALLSTSCSKTEEKIASYYHESISSFIYVDNNELIELANNKQDFILLLWSDCGCGGPTDSVIETFNKYIEESKLIIHAISSTHYQKIPLSLKDNFPLYPTGIEASEKIPSLYFYNDGKLAQQYSYKKEFKSTEGIKEIINKHVETNGFTSLNKIIDYTYDSYTFNKFDYSDTTLLDEKITNKNATICYSWNQCGDCNSLKKVLKSFFYNNSKTLYYFEVDHFRNQDNKSTLWDEISNGFPYKYGFSDYRGGKVPTFVTYINGEVKDRIVYHNDIIVDGLIQDSFFKELIGKEMSEKEIEEYHSNKILEYLNNVED